MIIMNIKLDEDKITHEKQFLPSEIRNAVIRICLGEGLIDQSDQNYLRVTGDGSDKELADVMIAIDILEKQPWFLKNVKDWQLIVDDETENLLEFKK